jgi:hypothetical protein
MAYNASTIRNLIEAGEIDRTSWGEHFSNIGENSVPSCTDCLDKKTGKCAGNSDPVECFLYGSHSRSDAVLLKNSR